MKIIVYELQMPKNGTRQIPAFLIFGGIGDYSKSSLSEKHEEHDEA
jgi:hypothetical protein